MKTIRIGTSGFSYDDWIGTFYPPSLKPNHRLEYYSGKFRTVELNSSLYQLPALPAVYGMFRKVPDEFDFFVKAHRDLTHVRRNAEATLPRFQEMLKAYERERKLAGTLFQFPANFECSDEHEDYLRWLVESLKGIRTVIEFRATPMAHRSDNGFSSRAEGRILHRGHAAGTRTAFEPTPCDRRHCLRSVSCVETGTVGQGLDPE